MHILFRKIYTAYITHTFSIVHSSVTKYISNIKLKEIVLTFHFHISHRQTTLHSHYWYIFQHGNMVIFQNDKINSTYSVVYANII